MLVRVKIRIPKQPLPEIRELYEKILVLEGKKAGEAKKKFFAGFMGKG